MIAPVLTALCVLAGLFTVWAVVSLISEVRRGVRPPPWQAEFWRRW